MDRNHDIGSGSANGSPAASGPPRAVSCPATRSDGHGPSVPSCLVGDDFLHSRVPWLIVDWYCTPCVRPVLSPLFALCGWKSAAPVQLCWPKTRGSSQALPRIKS